MGTFFNLPRVSFDDYLHYNERSEQKLEFLHGTVYAMAGASRFHNVIAANCISTLNPLLQVRGCQVLGSDQLMHTPNREAAFFPDLAVVCEGRVPQTNKPLENPILVIEVLSPSTRSFDLSAKLAQYQRVPSLRHILFIDSEEIGVQLFSRGEAETWPGTPSTYTDRAQTIALQALDIPLSLEAIYRTLDFSR